MKRITKPHKTELAQASFPKDWTPSPSVEAHPIASESDPHPLWPWFSKHALPFIVFEVRTTRVVIANSAAEKLLGEKNSGKEGARVNLSELAGMPRQALIELCRASSRGGPPVTLKLRTIDEKEHHLELLCGATLTGNSRHFFAFLIDQSHRVKVEQALEWRMRLESIIMSLSTHFLNLHGEKVDSGLNYALRSLGVFAGADRSYIFLFSDDGKSVSNTHEWCAEGVKPQIKTLQNLSVDDFPWFMERIQNLRTVHIPKVSALPAIAAHEKAELEREGVRSLVVVPMVFRGVPRGYLGFDREQIEKAWPEDIIALLRVAGELLINALERKRTDKALRDANTRYLNLFENTVEGVFQSTPDGQFLIVNPALTELLGWSSAAELIDEVKDLGEVFFVNPSRRLELIKLLQRDGQAQNFESLIRRKDGTIICISENVRAVFDGEHQLQLLEGTVIDITERKAMEAQLEHNALHDALTGLPNRTLLLERLGRALERSKRRHHDRSAILLLDLDRFKMINDGMGHPLGDQLLKEVADRLTLLLPPGATLSRLGGDEFALLLEEIDSESFATALADRIHQEFANPFNLEGHEVYVTGSIGIALTNSDSKSADDVLRDADTALHQAKDAGKARNAFFDKSMHTRAVKLLNLENDLRRALERNEFILQYQPIVDLKEAQLEGFEALIRWNHPQKGIVPPNDFIPIAEETGLIIPIGQWVLEEACRQFKAWQQLLPRGRQFTMSVNISGRQFQGLILAGLIEGICKQAGVDPTCLKLEITESAIIGNPEVAAAVLGQLEQKGFKLSLDDFGTGYSSLSYLHRFPFHNLKIDRSFIMELEADAKNEEIVRVINAMAKNLGMTVTAEGIETQKQWDRLRKLNTPYGQGFFFSRPLDPDAAGRWITFMGRPPEVTLEKS